MIVSRSKKKRKVPASPKILIGWREWVSLPDLDVPRIKAKIDTGARSSAMHAWGISPFERDGRTWVSFEVHPLQRNNKERKLCTALVVDQRRVKSSSGHHELRYVISTSLRLGEDMRTIEITLTNRDQMGFRLLLGRTALRGHYLVDPGKSFLVQRGSTAAPDPGIAPAEGN